jgi:chromosome partitioning protein
MSYCKVIALTNQKGGVGKTTTAVNLGVGLAKQGKRVLLIDADAQANLTMALGYSRPDDLPITLSTIMQNIIDDKSFDVSQGILSHSEGVALLPSNIELSGFEVRLINAMSRERVLKTYVNEVKKNYDYVLIDCMPSLGMITINALAAADSVVIPTQPHYLSAKGLELLLRSVSMVKRQINPKLRIDGILMTMLANSEFIIMLNQASTDRIELAKLLNISDLQLSYITNVGAGQGLLKVGSSLVPFVNKFPRNAELYKLMTTKFGEV